MDVTLERCAGLDVHRATVTACLRSPGPGPDRAQVIQTFGTTTPRTSWPSGTGWPPTR
jgi:transposase